MQLDQLEIRETTLNDVPQIMEVEERAFNHDEEAILTANLLKDETARPTLSLLAFNEQEAIGHILFTKARIAEKSNQPLFHILAPLAVIPAYQKMGVGGLLIRKGLKRLKEMGSEMVFVLGHIDYYPKYGFIPDAGKLGFAAPYPIPEKVKGAWMVQSLSSKGLSSDTGIIICADAMNKAEYWRE